MRSIKLQDTVQERKQRVKIFPCLFLYSRMHYPSGRTWANELSSVVRLERRTTEDSSSRRIIRLVPVFILETNNQTNNECLPKFVQTDNASSSIKTGKQNCLSRCSVNQSAKTYMISLEHKSENVWVVGVFVKRSSKSVISKHCQLR